MIADEMGLGKTIQVGYLTFRSAGCLGLTTFALRMLGARCSRERRFQWILSFLRLFRLLLVHLYTVLPLPYGFVSTYLP